MSQQLQITGGAKVRALEGVITGSSGVLSSLPINTSNGIPQLDVNGKILVSQLPNSVMEYQGTWNVVTNVPYLVNGVGNPGDVYIITNAAVGGTTHNFGAGNILFFNGDQTIYDGSTWQRASGSSGTVTSVAASITGNSIGITGSPITTAGTLAFAFAGTNLQYVNGAGDLTTFPSLTGYVPYTGATNDLNLGTHNLFANNLFDGFTNVAASGTQIVLTIASTPSYTITGSGGQTIKLPDATTLPNGAIFSFNNNQSSGAITINNNSNTLVVSVPSGGFAEVVLLDNSIAAGSWDRHFKAPSNVSWSTNTLDYAGSITSATWNGNVVAINRGGTGSSTQNFVDLSTTQTIGGAKTFTSALTANSLIKSGGTSSQFLKADGSVDSSSYITLGSLSFAAGSGAYNNTTGVITIPTNNNQITNGAGYITSSALAGYVPYTGATANLDMGTSTFGIASGRFLLFTKNGAAGVGNSSYIGFLNGASTDGIYAQLNASNNLGFYGMTSSVQTSQVAYISRAGDFSGNSFIKTGGTSSQFLKADGSIDSNVYLPLTGGTLTGTTSFDGSGGTQNPITFIYNTSVNRILTPVIRLYGATSISSNYVELFGLNATANRTINFPDASGTVALTSNLSSYVPYTGATGNVALGSNNLSLINLFVNNIFANNNGNDDIGSVGNKFRNIYATGLSLYKTSGITTINFPTTSTQNDAAFIQHEESTVDTGIMRFSVSDNDLSNDYFVFGNTNGTAGAFLERFKITSNGIGSFYNSLGVGSMSTPSYTLDVTGNGRYNNTSGMALQVNGGTFTQASASSYSLGVGNTGGSDLTLGTSTTAGVIQTWSSKQLSLNPQGNNVLIGSTTDGGYKLDVTGTVRFTSTLLVGGATTLSSTLRVNGGTTTIYDNTTATLNLNTNPDGEQTTGWLQSGGFYTILGSTGAVYLKALSTTILSVLDYNNFSSGTANGTGGNVLIATSVAQASNTGGVLSLGGWTTSTGSTTVFGRVAGRKENATSGNQAGYLAFETASASPNQSFERMRIRSSGVVSFGLPSGTSGILDIKPGAATSDGATLSATYSGTGSYGPFIFQTSDTTRMTITSNGTIKSTLDQSANNQFINLVGTQSSYAQEYSIGIATSTKDLRFYDLTAGVERMRITSGGITQINGTNGAVRLTLQNSDNTGYMAFTEQDIRMWRPNGSGADLTIGTQAISGSLGAGSILFQPANVEKMRITTSDGVLIGKTALDTTTKGVWVRSSGGSPSWTSFSNDGDTVAIMNRNTSTGTILEFKYAGTVCGSISYNGTTTVLNPTSDQRLKENIVDAGSGLEKLSKVKIRAYDWKQSGVHTDFGIVAQEIYESAPECVTVGSDELDENGNLKNPWCAQPYVLVSAAVKAIQELNQLVQELESRIKQLENK